MMLWYGQDSEGKRLKRLIRKKHAQNKKHIFDVQVLGVREFPDF